MPQPKSTNLERWKIAIVASLHVGALTASNVIHLLMILVITILLGRSSGPGELGVLSLAMAAGSIMQAVSSAGLVNVAIAALLIPNADKNYELRKILLARLIVIPAIFLFGSAVVFNLPGMARVDPIMLGLFFVGYSVGALDIANIAHTASGHFQLIAWRRICVTAAISPFVFSSAHAGRLEHVLLLLALQTALWQLVLFPGSGLQFRRLVHARLEWRPTLETIWRARSLWLAGIFGSLAQRIDLFIISAILGVTAAGYYSTASRPVEATTMVAGSLITVLFNSMAKNVHDTERYVRALVISARTMFAISCTLTAILIAIGPELLFFLYGSEFEPAATILPLYSLGIIFIFQKRVLDQVVVLEKEYGYTLSSSLSTIVVNILLNILFVPAWGLMGAAAASVLTHPISLLISFGPTARGRRLLTLAYVSIFYSQKKVASTINRD